MAPGELVEALQQEILAREQAEERAKQAELQVERLKEQLRSLGVDPDTINNL